MIGEPRTGHGRGGGGAAADKQEPGALLTQFDILIIEGWVPIGCNERVRTRSGESRRSVFSRD